MKRWQLSEARKYLTEIIDDVLQGEVQAIEKSGGETVYLIPGQKKCTKIANNDNQTACRALLSITSN